ncbi:NAD(P)/FAD-dependent oxidoreductase [Isoptericola cucumis]|uniref:Oxidoreductase n=3 Tax=Isoptericola cucumis TaxID=1776856 RepID=A0ABQ2BB68_9MICO|nr:FAD-dependent oxidoreductase [Isoptericola cucumis]GGI09896.1 oxidoreductase [Isoptericola cucumis]
MNVRTDRIPGDPATAPTTSPGADAAPRPAPGPEDAHPRSVVVVGAGLAGAQTVAALRAHGFAGHVTLLGAEGVPPYDRPPLSKELLTRPAPVWLRDDIGVDVEKLADDVRLADPATHLASPGSPGPGASHGPVAVTTASGARLETDAVVVAAGSEPVRPAGWESAAVLHTVDDAERLRGALRERPGLRLVVVGAGWIGAELAGVAAGAGADVTVVEAAASPLTRQLGAEVGAHLAPWYAAAGVRLLTGVPVAGVRSDGVALASGQDLPADLVLAAVGARPATRWLAGSLPLDARGSILVDGHGAVPGHPGVWALGDVASRAHPVFGTVPGGHWSAALHDPDTTVRAMLGVEPAPAHAPYVFSQQLGHDLALLGVPADDGAAHSPVVWRGRPGDGPWAAFYLDDGAGVPADGVATVRAVLLVDSPRDVGGVRRLMNRVEPLRLDLARAADPAVRIKDAVAG